MLPIALLMIEHRQIERMVPVLRAEAGKARGGTLDVNRVDALVDFMRTYADICHHGKEEEILFTALRGKEMPDVIERTMERLVEDHEVSRANVRTVLETRQQYFSGDSDALPRAADALDFLADLYPRHIETEDRHFFIQSMELLSKDEQARMLAQFQGFDRNLVHKLYRARMDVLSGPAQERKLLAKHSIEPGNKWACTVCDLVYDPVRGDQARGVPPGTNFEDLPDDWVCPLCGATKSAFMMLQS